MYFCNGLVPRKSDQTLHMQSQASFCAKCHGLQEAWKSSQLLLLTEPHSPRLSSQFTGNRSQSAWRSFRNRRCSFTSCKAEEEWSRKALARLALLLHSLLPTTTTKGYQYEIHFERWENSYRFIGVHLPSEECHSEPQRAVRNIYTSFSFSRENPYLIIIC